MDTPQRPIITQITPAVTPTRLTPTRDVRGERGPTPRLAVRPFSSRHDRVEHGRKAPPHQTFLGTRQVRGAARENG